MSEQLMVASARPDLYAVGLTTGLPLSVPASGTASLQWSFTAESSYWYAVLAAGGRITMDDTRVTVQSLAIRYVPTNTGQGYGSYGNTVSPNGIVGLPSQVSNVNLSSFISLFLGGTEFGDNLRLLCVALMANSDAGAAHNVTDAEITFLARKYALVSEFAVAQLPGMRTDRFLDQRLRR
jgi:hypothetical protein